MLIVLFAARSHSPTSSSQDLLSRDSPSSSALLYFFLVPIVLRELVVIVVCSPENFDSFSGVAHTRSITVERLPGLTVGFEFRSLIESPTGSSNPELFVSLLQDLLGEGVELLLFHHDLAKKEQCTSVCTKITPALLLVRIHAAYVIVNRLLFLCGRRFLQVLFSEITQCCLAHTRCDTCVAVRCVVRDCLLC